jgi:hypothetical protein
MKTRTRTVRNPQPIEESRMQGYFMISKRDAAVVITKKLTGNQCRLWLYLMLIDPFADYTSDGEIKYHDLPSIPEIAVAIGSSVEAVEKDFRKLRSLGLYEYRTVVIQGHNTTAANARAEADRLKSPSKSKPKPSQDNRSAYLSPEKDNLSPEKDNLSPEKDNLSPEKDNLSPEQQLEPLPVRDSGVSQTNQTNQTYQNFLSDLSNDERENFKKFALDKAHRLPNVPTLPQRWIEVHFEELRCLWRAQLSQWEKSQGKVSTVQASKWENHPQKEEWLEKIRTIGYVSFWYETNNQDEIQTRINFYDWAFAQKII